MTIHTLWLLPFGWILGAIVNYLADVLPRTRRFSKPSCPVCGEALPWHYTLWPRRCQACLQSRGSGVPLRVDGSVEPLRADGSALRPWIVLLLSAAAVLWLWPNPPGRLGFWGGVLLCFYFGLVVVIDIEHHLILHPVSVVGAVGGAGFGVYLHGALDTLLGGLAGFGIMLGLYFLGGIFLKLLIRIRGEETEEIPLGFGDVNLAGVIGLLLGWPGITAGLLLAILIGGAVSGLYLLVSLIRGRYRAYTALPYGPFLAASAMFLLLR